MAGPDPAPSSAQALLRACALPALESRALLCHVLGVSREHLVAHPDMPLTDAQRARFAQAAGERLAGMPLAYLIGRQDFYGHRFDVGPAVLVPRPDTELLVETALATLATRTGARVLELGTGSGCIAISLALARPDLWIVATDRSVAALQMARGNQDRLGSGVHFVAADWLAPLAGHFDLIVSNPPYIAAGDAHLAALRFEPATALTSGADGLDDLRRITREAMARLAPGGQLLLEHGYDQGESVRQLLAAAGFRAVRTLRDLAGHERVCAGVGVGMAEHGGV